MSLLFHYSPVARNRPVVSLGGRFVRPRPLVQVTVIGPTGSNVEDAILDTGADDSVFSERLANAIGVDLRHAPAGYGLGVGSGTIALRYAQVTLRLATNQERREWVGWVGFTAATMQYPVLGFAGCLQFFDAHFRGGQEEVELTINALFPGT
jgi:hypothetical protein